MLPTLAAQSAGTFLEGVRWRLSKIIRDCHFHGLYNKDPVIIRVLYWGPIGSDSNVRVHLSEVAQIMQAVSKTPQPRLVK